MAAVIGNAMPNICLLLILTCKFKPCETFSIIWRKATILQFPQIAFTAKPFFYNIAVN